MDSDKKIKFTYMDKVTNQIICSCVVPLNKISSYEILLEKFFDGCKIKRNDQNYTLKLHYIDAMGDKFDHLNSYESLLKMLNLYEQENMHEIQAFYYPKDLDSVFEISSSSIKNTSSIKDIITSSIDLKENSMFSNYVNKTVLNDEQILPESKDYFIKMLKHLICSICNGLYIDPISCKSCSNVYCRKCLQAFIDDNKPCPLDECFPIMIDEEIEKSLKTKLAKIKLRCYYECQTSTLTMYNYGSHLIKCEQENSEITCWQCMKGKVKKKDQRISLENFELLKTHNEKYLSDYLEEKKKSEMLLDKINNLDFDNCQKCKESNIIINDHKNKISNIEKELFLNLLNQKEIEIRIRERTEENHKLKSVIEDLTNKNIQHQNEIKMIKKETMDTDNSKSNANALLKIADGEALCWLCNQGKLKKDDPNVSFEKYNCLKDTYQKYFTLFNEEKKKSDMLEEKLNKINNEECKKCEQLELRITKQNDKISDLEISLNEKTKSIENNYNLTILSHQDRLFALINEIKEKDKLIENLKSEIDIKDKQFKSLEITKQLNDKDNSNNSFKFCKFYKYDNSKYEYKCIYGHNLTFTGKNYNNCYNIVCTLCKRNYYTKPFCYLRWKCQFCPLNQVFCQECKPFKRNLICPISHQLVKKIAVSCFICDLCGLNGFNNDEIYTDENCDITYCGKCFIIK